MKYDSTKHKFAVIMDGFCLYGVGETREKAIESAAEWIETEDKPQGTCSVCDVQDLLDHGYGDRVHGKYYVITDPDKIRQYVENV